MDRPPRSHPIEDCAREISLRLAKTAIPILGLCVATVLVGIDKLSKVTLPGDIEIDVTTPDAKKLALVILVGSLLVMSTMHGLFTKSHVSNWQDEWKKRQWRLAKERANRIPAGNKPLNIEDFVKTPKRPQTARAWAFIVIFAYVPPIVGAVVALAVWRWWY